MGWARFGSGAVRCIGLGEGLGEGHRIGDLEVHRIGLEVRRIGLGERRIDLGGHHIDSGELRIGPEELRIGVEVVRIRCCPQLKGTRRVSDMYLFGSCMLGVALYYRGELRKL